MRAVGAGRPRTLLLVALVLAAAACDMEGPASIADVGELKVSDEPVLGHPYTLQYSIACDYELELMDAGTIIEWTPMPGEELRAEHAWHPWWVEGSDGEDVLVARYNNGGPFVSPDSLVVMGYGTTLRGRDRVVIRHIEPEDEALAIYVYPPTSIGCKPAMGNIEYGRLVSN